MAIPRSIENAAVRATQLKRQIADLIVGLDKEKDAIRAWAATEKEKDAGLTMLEIPSVEGTCTVIFPADKPEFVKGGDPMVLLRELAPAKLALVASVETKMVFAKNFTEVYNGGLLSAEEKRSIERLVQWKPQTPRVEPAK